MIYHSSMTWRNSPRIRNVLLQLRSSSSGRIRRATIIAAAKARFPIAVRTDGETSGIGVKADHSGVHRWRFMIDQPLGVAHMRVDLRR